MPLKRTRVFLTAEWRRLIMLNYAIEPGLLQKYVPKGVELDDFEGGAYVSLVAFQFLNTRVLGVPVPFHRDFEELNLRFYVRCKRETGWERGVVFIKEVVPRWAIAAVARGAYNENYVCAAMRCRNTAPPGAISLCYEFKGPDGWCAISASGAGAPEPLREGSCEEFIAEHYYGYAVQRNGGTKEYRVDHPPWNIWHAGQAGLSGALEWLYDEDLCEVLKQPPSSAFIADGSEVSVHSGVWLRQSESAG